MKKILKVYYKTKSRNKMKLLNNLTLTDIRGKIINTKDVKIKIIQKILNKKSIPKCQDKWNNVYNEEFLKCLLKL
jgi:transcription antitermination factor NusA-like protein